MVSIDTMVDYRPRNTDLLLRAPLFAAMPTKVVDGLALRASRRKLRKGQRVLARSDAAVVVLLTGRLEVVSDHGDEVQLVRSLVPPAVVGVSVAVGAEAGAEIWVAEDAEVVLVPADAVAAAVRRYPDAAIAAIAHLGGVVAELSAEVAALRMHGLVGRVRHRLHQLAAGRREVSITHARLAKEVGGTRANVSRALGRLEREGVIRRRRGRIELG